MPCLQQPPRVAVLAASSRKAQAARNALAALYPLHPPEQADVIVALGGDGFMLRMLRDHVGGRQGIYGMNRGTVGFLMNAYHPDNLLTRLQRARGFDLRPLRMRVTTEKGAVVEAIAINEVSLFRRSHQAARIDVFVDGVRRLSGLTCDGVMVATPAGSTAYNLSAHGPILPFGAKVLALTPISPFRPRRWRGALLPDNARIELQVLEHRKRPVSAVADDREVRNVTGVDIVSEPNASVRILFDPEHNLEERILKEQFIT